MTEFVYFGCVARAALSPGNGVISDGGHALVSAVRGTPTVAVHIRLGPPHTGNYEVYIHVLDCMWITLVMY